MRRFIRYFVLLLFVAIVAVTILAVVYMRQIFGYQPEIAAVRFDLAAHEYCSEPPTTHDFDQFWIRFREAIRAQNKDDLLSLIHTCSFRWEPRPGERNLQLKRRNCVVSPINTCIPPDFMVGDGLLIENRRDLDLTYNRIFPKAVQDRIIKDAPWKESEGRYDLSWDSGPNKCLSLVFENIDKLGYKFTGVEWGPYPVSFLKQEAKRHPAWMYSQPSPPPNSIP